MTSISVFNLTLVPPTLKIKVYGLFFCRSFFKGLLLKHEGNTSLKVFSGAFYFGFLSVLIFSAGSTGASVIDAHKKKRKKG
jgi:hypothetical protein